MGTFVSQLATPTLSRLLSIAPRLTLQTETINAIMDLRTAIRGERVNVKNYGAVGNGSTDDTEAVLLAIAALSGSSGVLYFPAGTYRISPGAISSGSGRLTIPSNTTVCGDGPQSIVKFTGVAAAAEGGGFVYDLFRIADGSSNIVFRDLMVKGENSPFTYYSQNQSAAIGFAVGSGTSDVAVRNVWFQYLYGFSVHDPGENARTHVIGCYVKDCSNGINVNSNYSLQQGNSIENSEGIEFSGKHSSCIGNVIRNARGSGISAGGNTGGGAKYPGQVVSDNIIDGAVDGIGIVFGEATLDAVCSGNTVRKCDNGGISIASGNIRRGVLVSHNVIGSNCKSGGGTIVGLNINGTGKHHVVGNICRDEGETGFEQKYACAVYAPTCAFSGNFFSGTTQDIEFQSTATNTFYDSSNYHENGNVSIVAGATFSVFGIGLESSDSSGTPGDATINKPSGRSKISAGMAGITITNSLVAAGTKVIITPRDAVLTTGTLTDANPWYVSTTSGSFSLTFYNALDNAVTFDWLLVQPT